MSKFKIGIIGAGSMSKMHLDAYGMLTNVEVTAICDIIPEHVREKAEQFKVPKTYSDHKRMFSECDLDAVSIITPNHLHAPITLDALNAGLHVLCEKPPAMNAQQAVSMADCAKSNNRLLMYGFVFRFMDKVSAVKELQQNGMFGDIYYGKAGIVRRCENPGGWFCNSSYSRGGPLIDLGVHIIDLAMYLMDNSNPATVFASTFNKMGSRNNIKGYSWYHAAAFDSPIHDVENLAVALIKFKNDATLFIETSYASHIKAEKVYMDLVGDRGGVTVEPGLEIFSEQHDYLMDIKPVLDDTTFNWEKAVKNEIRHFIQCIQDDSPCLSSAEDGVKVMKVIDAIYQSAESGHAVSLENNTQ